MTILVAITRTQLIGYVFIDGGCIWEIFFAFIVNIIE